MSWVERNKDWLELEREQLARNAARRQLWMNIMSIVGVIGVIGVLVALSGECNK